MKINSNNILPIKYETIKLKDKETDKDISFKVKSDEVEKIGKKVSNVESYFQTMYDQYQKDGNIDEDNDGYLDSKELIKSKRFVKTNVDKNENINFTISSLQDIVNDDKKVTQIMEDILKDDGYIDGKISIKKDFLEYVSMDSDRDTIISDKEIFKDMKSELLSTTFKNFLLEQILAMIKKNEDNVFNDITKGAFNNSSELDKKSKTLDFLSDEEKSVFSSTKGSDNTISIIDLLGRKEKSDTSKKYINTQADNAKIFSLKV